MLRASIHGAGPMALLVERLARLSASFPVWRFAAQTVHEESLFGAFGLTRLSRPTDVRDASLPEPDRDEWGVGWAMRGLDHYWECRRAYLLIADIHPAAPLALMVRNNSPYFGHDRLPVASLWSTRWPTADALMGLTPEQLHRQAHRDAEQAPQIIRTRLEALADRLERRLDAFDAWLEDPTQGVLVLARVLNGLAEAGRPLPYLTRQPTLHAPAVAVAVTPEVRAALTRLGQGEPLDPVLTSLWGPERAEGRLVLASGPHGDGVGLISA